MNIFVKFWDYYVEFNLKRTTGIDLEINKILLVIALGFCAANLFINYKQSKISTVLRKLIRKKAYGEENAVTLKQIGLADNKSYGRLLNRKEGVLKTLVSSVGDKRKDESAKECGAASSDSEPDKDSARQIPHIGGSSLLAEVKREITAEAQKGAELASENAQSETKDEKTGAAQVASPTRYYIPFESQNKAIQMLERNNASFTKALLGSALILACTMALVLLIPPVVNWIFI